ncbi:hypothetical protein GmHk_01G000748 [Glycine max]|nr:hypothetical protein GmHk_01G000748 [Glycine max]
MIPIDKREDSSGERRLIEEPGGTGNLEREKVPREILDLSIELFDVDSGEQEGMRANPIELSHFVEFIKQNKLQTKLFIIGFNQYLVTLIPKNWFSARCINISKPSGEGAIIIQTTTFILVVM